MLRQLTEEERVRRDARDKMLDRLSRLRGMFGAVRYLMGADDRRLENEHEDFELWICDIRDRLDEAIAAAGEIQVIHAEKS